MVGLIKLGGVVLSDIMELIQEMPKKRVMEYMKISLRHEVDFLDSFSQYLGTRKSDQTGFRTISKFSFEKFCCEKSLSLQVST